MELSTNNKWRLRYWSKMWGRSKGGLKRERDKDDNDALF